MASLMGLPPGTTFELVLPPPEQMTVPELSMSIEQMEQMALENRPELREERYQQRISSVETRKALLSMFPSLNLSATAYSDSNSFLVYQNWADTAARLSWDLLNLARYPAARRTAESAEAVAATAVAVPAAATQAPAPVDTTALARMFVEDWFNAWQAQDVAGYFSHYADDFMPANDQTQDEWRSQRERNITRHDSISIELESFNVVAEAEDSLTVEFDMHFTAPTYEDRTSKQVVLRREDDMLSILAESNLSVQVL